MTPKTLTDLHKKNQGKVSDKWSSYLDQYERLFNPLRDRTISLFEIGIQNGGSLEILSKYFPRAKVFVGCDIDQKCSKLIYQDPRINLVIGDANQKKIQKEVIQKGGPFDVVIDDGSHRSGDIIKSFVNYFPHLVDNGMYVIEDLHCSYWEDFEGGLFAPYSSMMFFKQLTDLINYEHWGVSKDFTEILEGFSVQYDLKFKQDVLKKIESIEFLNSMCVIRKSSGKPSGLGLRLVCGKDNVVSDAVKKVNLTKSIPPSQVNNVFSKKGERDVQLQLLNQTLGEREFCISELKKSRSWRLTKPFRSLKDFLEGIRATVICGYKDVFVSIWQSTLVNIVGRDRIKSLLFFCGFFHNTGSYISWKADRETRDSWRQRFLDKYSSDSKNLGNYFVKKINYSTKLESSIRFIAFYLPQFHEIKENNKWWGKGFTEWTNVRPAKPNFFGHYQPHIPDLELGHYDLLSSDIFPKQIELAKNYGIDGFCFYVYWFNGRRLLEKPLENYLQDKSLDLPFCLCWANENWTRSWDGLEANVLLAQNHSPEDDIDFIKNFSQFFLDKRYIKINEKPLLVIYRPNLFPDMKSTSNRWRAWCRNNGFGEIYLAYTQSFECVDPDTYGLDGAIEFPPNNATPPEVTKYIPDLEKSFKGKIFDWSVFPERSESYKNPGYELYRGVCPSWDNTARKKKSAFVFLNSSPTGYGKWLFNAILDTCKRFADPDKRIIFINAWNEWAEGAHLEPDQKYGYGYLSETRRAKIRLRYSNLQAAGLSSSSSPKLLILIHAYYLDVFFNILEMIKKLNSIEFDVLITTTPDNYREIESATQTFARKVKIVIHQNKGRDVLPFIKELPAIINSGYEFVIKLHTKKSLHRDDGDSWRDELLSNLLSKKCVDKNMQIFQEFKDVGLIGPSGNVVPLSYYWGSNKKNVINLSKVMGVNSQELNYIPFVAGTIFIARVDALKPLAALNLTEEQFESECGQLDGTLAHAIERLIAVSATSAGYRVVSSDLEVNLNFKYAVRTI
jgi:lipopolysaccharide biosynthesis protein